MATMKLLEEQKRVKKWGVKFVDTDKGIEIWAADVYNQSLLAPMAIFYHHPGGFERFDDFKDILETKGYDPYQHEENSYLKDGAVETMRDKMYKEERVELKKNPNNSILFPVLLWMLKSAGVLKRS